MFAIVIKLPDSYVGLEKTIDDCMANNVCDSQFSGKESNIISVLDGTRKSMYPELSLLMRATHQPR